MSIRGSFAPSVPPAEEPLVTRLRELFAPLRTAPGAQGGSIPDGPVILKDMFLKGETIPLSAAERDFPNETIDLLLDSGLMQMTQGELRLLFRLQTFRNLLILTDLPSHNRLPEYVLPVGAASRSMARLAIRRPVEQALDMGCGAGIQSLLAASHARHVTATDINPRALALTRLNAALNGIDNIETLQGSHFEPVGGRAFDLILFNAPYILSPLTEHSHSHAGAGGDSYLYDLLEDLPAHLNEGGFAQVVSNWTHRATEPWWTPLQRALSSRGLDALVLCRASLSTPRYADFWLRFEIDRKRRPVRYALASLRWRSWYLRHHIERIAFGSLTLRRRSTGENWLRFEKATTSFGDSLSDQLLTIFHNRDRGILQLTPAELASRRPRLVNFEALPGADGKGRRLFLTGGQAFPLQVRRITYAVLPLLDGQTTLETAIGEAARKAGLQADIIRPSVLEDMLALARFGWIALDP